MSVLIRVSLLTSLILCLSPDGTAQTPGPNVNMVTGTEWPGGDPFLQRQNEPSLAVSSRNMLHLFGGANDYRTVDLPGLPNGVETGDAWLGIFKSFDGGQTWISNLVPGYPQDTSAEGVKSPLKGYQAAADPTVRAGSNGLFYYSGLAFNRAPKTGSTVFVARYVDDNNETPDTIRYLGTRTIGQSDDGPDDSSRAGSTQGSVPFADKPSLAVDIPRGDADECSVPDPSGSRGRSFRAGNVYVAYTLFLGNTTTSLAPLLFARSTDCGVSWSDPITLSGPSSINQGSVIAIDPRNGDIYVAWRRFALAGQPDAVMYVRSTNGGATFSSASVISTITPFDQGSSTVSFRTNTFPALAVDSSGSVYVAWSELGAGPGGDARILYSVSNDGTIWSPPAAADLSPQRGHQFLPALASNAGQITLFFYDLREDHTLGYYSPEPVGQLSETRLAVGYDPGNPTDLASVFNPYIADAVPPLFTSLLPRRHTLDVRVAQVSLQTAPGFGASVNVSQYLVGSTPDDPTFRQLQVNPPDLPMFVQGTTPFIGDYIDIAPQTIVPNGRNGWKFNDAPASSATAHAVWADNRDVRPPPDGDWTKYTPIRPTGVPSLFDPTQTVAACDPFRAGMRNQNIYTSSITGGLVAASTGNSKQLDPNLLRAFTVFASNTASGTKSFRFTITAQPPGGMASFLQFPVVGAAFPLAFVDVTVPPQSGVSRTVFATSTNARAPIPVTVTEITAPGQAIVSGGLQGAVTINADFTNPNISNPNISNVEIYNPNISNPNISNPNISNPNISNPNISNPNISNPTLSALDLATPNISNPNISNPNISNPNISNPNISNPNISNSDLVVAPIDTTWTLTNNGNTAASYSLKLLTSGFIPPNAKFQLLISRVNLSPALAVDPITFQCQLGTVGQYLPFSNVTAPAATSSADLTRPAAFDTTPSNATVPLASGESVQVTLRTFDAPAGFDPTSVITTAVVPQAANTGQTQPTIVASGPPIVTTTSPLPLAVAGSVYMLPLQAAGGTGSLTWSGANLPPGLALTPGGVLTGTPTTVGTFVLTATVTDQSAKSGSVSLSLTVSATPVLALGTTSLPNATLGAAYRQNLVGSGGTAPYTFGLISGSSPLPPGLTLDTNGLLSGTPTAIGAFGFTVQILDSAGHAQIFALSITVGASSGSSLVFLSTPSNITVGQILPPLQVSARTAANVPIPGVPVTLTMGNTNPSGGRLTGNTTVTTDASGIATFTGISVDRIGAYNLTATVLGVVPSGSFQIVPAPSSIAQGVLENDTLIRVFPEKLAVTLSAPLSVNASAPGSYSSFASLSPSFIPAGMAVDAYYLHADPVGQSAIRFQSATFTFPTPILGVEMLEPQLGSGDALVGAPGTQYVRGRNYEIGNPQDSFVISPDGRTVSVSLANSGATDDMRVIIASAQASTHIGAGTSASFTVSPVPGLISTYAGKWPAFTTPGNGQATSVSLGAARLSALDGSGNLYFPDSDLNQVFKVTPAGVISVVAGTGARGFSGDGGLATGATLNNPYAVAVDTASNVYIADTFNGAVRRVDAISGVITTIAGGGPYGQDNVPALENFLDNPLGLAFNPLNPANLYIAEEGASRIRKIDLSTGTITTVAGTGTPGFNGDSISATTAQLNSPWDIAFDAAGNLYIADTFNSRVRMVSGGTITTVAGTGVQSFSGDGGPATSAALCQPFSVSLDAAGEIFISDGCANRIRRVSGGIITTVAGTGTPAFSGDGGPATSADLWEPTGVTADAAGNLYISDLLNRRIRKVSGTTITTYAGSSSSAVFGGDGGPATSALLDNPLGVAIDAAGNLYVGDSANFRVRRISPGGTISTYAGDGQVSEPLGDNGPATNAPISSQDLAVDGAGNLYDLDYGHGPRIRKITPGGIISTIAGNGSFGFSGDNGPAINAAIAPSGVAADTAGNVYIAENANNRVRKVDTSGTITTVAGTGTAGFGGDNGLATSALLNQPQAVAVDSAGNLYIADNANLRVRRVTPGGIITTVAGNGTAGFTPDGGSALGPLRYTSSVAVDIADNLYVANGGRLQRVDLAGLIETVAGNGAFDFAGDGAPGDKGSINRPNGVAVDTNGNVFVSDSGSYRVREISGAGPLVPASRLTITTTSLTAPLNFQLLTGLNWAGGTGSLTWSLIGGSLPPGLTMDAAGNLTGTPTVAGVFTALVQLTDSGTPQQSTMGNLQIQVQ